MQWSIVGANDWVYVTWKWLLGKDCDKMECHAVCMLLFTEAVTSPITLSSASIQFTYWLTVHGTLWYFWMGSSLLKAERKLCKWWTIHNTRCLAIVSQLTKYSTAKLGSSFSMTHVCVRACVYIHTCVCVCVYIHMYIYTYIRMCIHTHTHTLALAREFSYLSVRIYARIYLHMYIWECMFYVHTYVYVSVMYICKCVYVCVYVRVCVCLCMYIYAYVCMGYVCDTCMYVRIRI